jgi:hypothetical protein
MAHLYGPAVRCKPNMTDLEIIGLAHLYSALEWSVLLLAIMDIRARPISFASRPLEGRMCHQIADVTVRPFLHLLQFDSQTSAGIPSCSLLRLA